MNQGCHHHPKDWVDTPTRFSLAWGLPVLVLVGTVNVESSLRAWAWFVALSWMGIACCTNVLRCGRRHCYFTGPFFLLMACLTLLYGLGILEFGPQGWMRLAFGLVIGTTALWWLPEQIWGRFADNSFAGSPWNSPRVTQGKRGAKIGGFMSTEKLRISGMTCDHCARTLEQALNGLPGVTARVSYQEALAYVETTGKVDPERVLNAVQTAGYRASLLEDDREEESAQVKKT